MSSMPCPLLFPPSSTLSRCIRRRAPNPPSALPLFLLFTTLFLPFEGGFALRHFEQRGLPPLARSLSPLFLLRVSLRSFRGKERGGGRMLPPTPPPPTTAAFDKAAAVEESGWLLLYCLGCRRGCCCCLERAASCVSAGWLVGCGSKTA